MCFPGTQTALFATLMGLTGPGDGVLVGDPFYATYEGVIRASGAHRQSVPLEVPKTAFASPQRISRLRSRRNRAYCC
jgi:arginine:pyruvate transaminase